MAIIRNQKIKLDKKDYFRGLLTDTAPNDVPIIFSNEGFYVNSHRANTENGDRLNKIVSSIYANHIDPTLNKLNNGSEALQKKLKYSSPFKYKIIKNEYSLRTLSLTHPRTQLNLAEFYRDHSPEINYLCSKSNFSVRAPVKVGNSFTVNRTRKISSEDYKNIDIDTLESELYKKSASSFFTYRGYTRLYKIYNSERFVQLEKKYNQMWLLDIANCFDSIYTHSISWAVKDKQFIKDHVTYSSQVCQKMDTIMQRSNNNETNGICIGAEFSRVFSEIIFQKIDKNIEEFLDIKMGLKHEIDYEVIRYVDDYMIFASSEKVAKSVYKAISDSLNEYNLYLSDSKTHKYSRPFCTEKSALVVGLNMVLNELESSLFEVQYFNKQRQLFPKKIYRKFGFKNNFIDKVKKLCIENKSDYSLPSNFLISVFNKRINEVILHYRAYMKNISQKALKEDKNLEQEVHDRVLVFRDALELLLNLTLFFYSVKPSLSASNKVSQSIIKIDRFVSAEMPEHLAFMRSFIMASISENLYFSHEDSYREGFTHIEQLNILLATSEFNDNYLVSADLIQQMINKNEEPSYFEIVSLLYYCKGHEQYKEIVSRLEKSSLQKVLRADLSKDSEAIHLFLDLMCCPYISKEVRQALLGIERQTNTELMDLSNTNDDYSNECVLAELLKTYWFVKWSSLDLYELLARKELNPVY
ncbi:antiviral reverse transcriptase Drt3b [Catenovulum maritimum]|uniref:Reverse transcriptase domain-containing protein n=1 Tax=Catenovulum maritimum TaxID=1513271 RepID=A0A0J8GYI4_9ALTE|nr:antiviral reverse transcriptase Drt3b [Catenovulum maritimum]KMT65793.1 hypothetical protein XM47_07265 [Catenovulum maritimum]